MISNILAKCRLLKHVDKARLVIELRIFFFDPLKRQQLFATLMANRRAQVAARGMTWSSSDSCSQHVNSIWLLRVRLFLSFVGDMVNKNIVKSEIKYSILYNKTKFIESTKLGYHGVPLSYVVN